MKRIFILFFLLVILLYGCTVYVQPPRQNPKLLIKEKPSLIVVTDFGNVFRAKRYDGNLFFYDGRWYYFEHGYWYVSQYWKGPFVYVRVIPAKVINARKRIKFHKKYKINNGYHKGRKKGRKW